MGNELATPQHLWNELQISFDGRLENPTRLISVTVPLNCYILASVAIRRSNWLYFYWLNAAWNQFWCTAWDWQQQWRRTFINAIGPLFQNRPFLIDWHLIKEELKHVQNNNILPLLTKILRQIYEKTALLN